MSQINLLTNERIVDRTNTEYYNALRTKYSVFRKRYKSYCTNINKRKRKGKAQFL